MVKLVLQIDHIFTKGTSYSRSLEDLLSVPLQYQ